MKTVGYCILFLFSTMMLSRCGKGGCNVISEVSFNTGINQAEHPGVYATNGYAYAPGGVRGLIVYNTGDGLVAYDRCSTVAPEKRNQVVVDGLLIVDEASGAKWLLRDGSPTHIAECSLRRYNVRKSGAVYYVSN
ncbi:hypothetical protein G5B00_03935 [Parapedobacter sp. SGR-10]|nr:hypothetical protein [Parapedobacter sp. SGR-10]